MKLSDPPLPVTFDVSVLGYGAYGAGGRTGVYRMAECLARELSRRPEVKLAFSGGDDWRMWSEAVAWLKNDSELGQVRRIHDGVRRVAYERVGRLYWPLVAQGDLRGIPRLSRKVLGWGMKAIQWPGPPVPANLKGVYHSPYYPLPTTTRQARGLARVLTVCDLFNLMGSQESTDQGAFLLEVLGSLKPEDTVVTISQSTRDDLLRFRPDLDPNAVISVPLAAAQWLGPAKDEDSVSRMRQRFGAYWLSVCTLDPRKNLARLLEAFKGATETRSMTEHNLVLCGFEGHSAQSLYRQIAELRLEGRVHCLGFVPDAELVPLYSGALGFVYPSLGEGFGLPVLEAMQCAVPVVTSNTGALREVAQDAAVLVNPISVNEISAALVAVTQDFALREKLRGAGLVRARQYSWSMTVDQLINVYRSAYQRVRMGAPKLSSSLSRRTACST